MSSESAAAPHGAAGEPEINHTRRFATIWVIANIIFIPIVILLVGPLLGPGGGSDQSSLQGTDMTVLGVVATPVILLVMLYLPYALVYFRQPKGGMLEGPAIRGDAKVQTAWIVITSVMVLGVAIFGTVELEAPAGAGSGSGPTPLTKPSGPVLPVQVIAQQWLFTYRYPTYGGFETTNLELPVGKTIEFQVTSLDVIHDFWAYQLGVKADANPGVDNIAYAKPEKTETFEIHCAELCGIWHGAMRAKGKVVSEPEFETWIHSQQQRFAPATKVLPPYAKTYLPEPTRRG